MLPTKSSKNVPLDIIQEVKTKNGRIFTYRRVKKWKFRKGSKGRYVISWVLIGNRPDPEKVRRRVQERKQISICE